MEKLNLRPRIVSLFLLPCLLAGLLACQNRSPRETPWLSTADHLSYPKHVALLLPLQGDLASQSAAVREGYMAAYYLDAQNKDIPVPTVTVLNTQGQDVVAVYQNALAKGADFIVGPLTKPEVSKLLGTHSSDVPILALNNIDRPSSGSFYQFGLSPEDEAREAAYQAARDGHRNALLFIQNGNWGTRVAETFEQAFRESGGKTVDTLYFSTQDDLSQIVSKGLGLSSQMSQAQLKSKKTGLPTTFEPRIRSDIDMIFMAALPQQARQIPPLLAFYFAKSLPIYATASIYSGVPNPKTDQDLSGVIFCDIPWNVEEKPRGLNTPDNAVIRLWPSTPRPRQRLYALGVDAYELTPRAVHMRNNHTRFAGATGLLEINSNGQVARTLPCTRFENGAPVRLNAPQS